MKNYAYITLLSNDGYLDGVLLMKHSLDKVNTKYPLYCMINDNVNEYSKRMLEAFGIPTIYVDNIAMPEHIQRYNESIDPPLAYTWRNCLTKYHIFKMTQFDKLIFLDADLYFQKNVDHVFEYGHMTGAVDGEAFNLWLDTPHLNTGFFVVEPSEKLFNDLMEFANKVDPSFHDWVVADQEILNRYYKDWPTWQDKHLDAMYNVFPPYIVPEWCTPFQIEKIMKNTIFYHFVGTKPWMVDRYVNDGFNFLYRDLAYIKEQKKQLSNLPKIAMYAICKNELEEVDEWFKTVWESDYICVLDTGSTDGTYEKLLAWQKAYPNKVIINQEIITPWRFDVARNKSMELIPAEADICMCTDFDERLVKGWDMDVRINWTDDVDRILYKYAWSHNSDGTPGRIFWYDKIHRNGGWFWKYPVHEALHPYDETKQYKLLFLDENVIYLHHYPKLKQGRSSYIDLLKIRVNEDPTDLSSWQYLTHEYLYTNQPEECINTALESLVPNLSSFDEPMAEPNTYFFIGSSYMMMKDFKNARKYFQKGIKTGPTYRENYLGLAKTFIEEDRYDEAIEVINTGLKESTRFYIWLERDSTWTWEPYDLLANCYYKLEKYNTALDYAELALLRDSTHPNLINNANYLRTLVKN